MAANEPTTTIDITYERLMTLREAAEYLPKRNGKRVHLSTLHRWTSRGCQGVCLETVRLGGTRMTSVEALQRFIARSTDASAVSSNHVSTTTSRRRHHEAAKRKLDDARI